MILKEEYKSAGLTVFNSKNEVIRCLDTEFEQKMQDPEIKEYFQQSARGFKLKSVDNVIKDFKIGNIAYRQELVNLSDVKGIDVAGNSYEPTDDGLFYDIDKVVAGEPENMLTNTPEKKKAIKVAIDIAFPHTTDTSSIEYRAAAIFKILYTLMAKGYILDIFFYMFWQPKTKICPVTGVKRKKHCDIYRLSQNELSFQNIMLYCSTFFFRGINFYVGATHNSFGVESYALDQLPFQDRDLLFFPGGYISSYGGQSRFSTMRQADVWAKNMFGKYILFTEEKNEF